MGMLAAIPLIVVVIPYLVNGLRHVDDVMTPLSYRIISYHIISASVISHLTSCPGG